MLTASDPDHPQWGQLQPHARDEEGLEGPIGVPAHGIAPNAVDTRQSHLVQHPPPLYDPRNSQHLPHPYSQYAQQQGPQHHYAINSGPQFYAPYGPSPVPPPHFSPYPPPTRGPPPGGYLHTLPLSHPSQAQFATQQNFHHPYSYRLHPCEWQYMPGPPHVLDPGPGQYQHPPPEGAFNVERDLVSPAFSHALHHAPAVYNMPPESINPMHPTHEEPETPITPSAQLPANQQPTSQPSQDAGPIKDVKRQEEFKYKCIHTGCLKYFKSPAALKAHSVRHTGEKRFFCSLEGCDKSYTTNNRLKVHLRSHTGEKPYVCDHPGCTYATVQKCNLTLHQECHLDSAAKAAIQRARMPTVPCKFCRRLFVSMLALDQHSWREHNRAPEVGVE